MPANIAPIYVLNGNLTANGATAFASPITASANDVTGAGANNVLVFTAGANGSLIQKLRFKANGTNVASLARIFLNNGLANTTATNNTYFDDLPLPASTISTTALTGATIEYSFSANGLLLESGFRIYVGLTVAVAAGWSVIPVAGDY